MTKQKGPPFITRAAGEAGLGVVDRHPIGAMRIPRAKTTLGDLSARRRGLIARSVSTSPLACVSFIGVTSCTFS
jgi:hypothetical protein